MTNKIEKELYKTIENIIKYPNSTICKHYVALQIIIAMKNSGINIDNDLLLSISKDSEGDIETLNLIKNKL